MRAEILTKDELTREDIDAFWKQGVCMDDWDYVILAPLDTIDIKTEDREGYDYDTGRNEKHSIVTVTQNDFTLDRMLFGCCSNEWYKATFRGQEYAVGVAYHA